MPLSPRARRLRRIAIELLVVVGLVAAVGVWRARDHARGPLPSIALAGLDGRPVSLRAEDGRPTLLVFFAPWCDVCKLTAQNLRWAAALAGGTRVVSVACDYGDDMGAVRAYAAEHELPGTVLLDDGSASTRFGVRAYPAFFFVDGGGRITGSTVGYTTTLGLLARLWL